MSEQPVETGVSVPADAASAPDVQCPNCGSTLKTAPTPDGGVAAETCSKCYKPPSKSDVKEAEKAAAAQAVPTETGVIE